MKKITIFSICFLSCTTVLFAQNNINNITISSTLPPGYTADYAAANLY